MNAVAKPIPAITQIHSADLPAVGSPLGGGFYIARYRHRDEIRALIVAPKAEGEIKRIEWGPTRELLAAAMSFTDGLANTVAMAAAGSILAIKVRTLLIGGADDWCLPALDQQEVLYRTCKPTSDKNACWSGCNINAVPPTQRYLPESPAQTALESYRAGGAEAFETDDYYWSSTQYAGNPDYAWYTYFDNGHQYGYRKDDTCRARPVRSILVI